MCKLFVNFNIVCFVVVYVFDFGVVIFLVSEVILIICFLFLFII